MSQSVNTANWQVAAWDFVGKYLRSTFLYTVVRESLSALCPKQSAGVRWGIPAEEAAHCFGATGSADLFAFAGGDQGTLHTMQSQGSVRAEQDTGKELHFSFNESNLFKHVQSFLVSSLLLWLSFCACVTLKMELEVIK